MTYTVFTGTTGLKQTPTLDAHTMKKPMLSNPELYKIYRKHVASDGLIDMMDSGQFLDAARDVMRIIEDAYTNYHKEVAS